MPEFHSREDRGFVLHTRIMAGAVKSRCFFATFQGLLYGVVAMCSSASVGVGEGAEAFSSANFGRPGALLDSSVVFSSGGKRFRGCRTKRLY